MRSSDHLDRAVTVICRASAFARDHGRAEREVGGGLRAERRALRGLLSLRRISPLIHPVDSSTPQLATSNRRSASRPAFSGARHHPLSGMLPIPRQCRGIIRKTREIRSRAVLFPSSGTARVSWFSTSARPSSSCLTHMGNP